MDRAAKLKRALGAGAFVAVTEMALLWGIARLTPKVSPLEIAPEVTNIDIWPQWRRSEGTSPKITRPKTRLARRSSNITDALDASTPAEAAVAPITEVPSPDRSSNDLPPDLLKALRGRQACQAAMVQGKPQPPNCLSKDYAANNLSVVPKDRAAYWDKIITAKEAQQRYRTEPGNSDYWRRVTTLRNYRDDVQRPGAYSDPNAQWFFSPDIQPDSARVGK